MDIMEKIEKGKILLSLIEDAYAPSTTIDSAIEDFFGWPNAYWTGLARNFTSCLNASTRALPPGWLWSVKAKGDGFEWFACSWPADQPIKYGTQGQYGSTPELALCATLIWAHMKVLEEQ